MQVKGINNGADLLVEALRRSKCAKNIEKVKVMDCFTDKLYAMEEIPVQNARRMVTEFGKEVSVPNIGKRDFDKNYYEVHLGTSDAQAKASIKIDYKGNLIQSLSRGSEKYSIETFPNGVSVKTVEKDGVEYISKQSGAGDVFYLSERSADNQLYVLQD